MSFWRSDKFKSLYKCVLDFDVFGSAKGHQLNIQKHDLHNAECQTTEDKLMFK